MASGNTAAGGDALFSLTTGFGNTAIGSAALYSNTIGAITQPSVPLRSSTIPMAPTQPRCLMRFSFNTTGDYNTAIGYVALENNTTGDLNTAIGAFALFSNTTGRRNTATGYSSLFSNTTGIQNTAYGAYALFNNISGSNNIALGFTAGTNLTTGNNNIDIGNLGVAGEANTIRIGDRLGTTDCHLHCRYCWRDCNKR